MAANSPLGRGKGCQALGWVVGYGMAHPGASHHPSREGILLGADDSN